MTKKRHHLRSVVAIAICLAAVVISSGCCKMDSVEDERIFGMTYHDNEVIVKTIQHSYGNLDDGNVISLLAVPWTIEIGRYELTDFDVTSGQDPDHNLNLVYGLIFSLNSNSGFVFTVGRKGSKEVAESFNRACPPEHNTFGHTADELNFWMKGTMTLLFRNGKRYTFPNTFFAQGHAAAVNNWWFGNDAMTNSTVSVTLYDPFKSMYVTMEPPSNSIYGYISPMEDPNLVFLFRRGTSTSHDLFYHNIVYIIGVYQRTP